MQAGIKASEDFMKRARMSKLSLKLQKLRARRQGQPQPTRKMMPKTQRVSKHPKRELDEQA